MSVSRRPEGDDELDGLGRESLGAAVNAGAASGARELNKVAAADRSGSMAPWGSVQQPRIPDGPHAALPIRDLEPQSAVAVQRSFFSLCVRRALQHVHRV